MEKTEKKGSKKGKKPTKQTGLLISLKSLKNFAIGSNELIDFDREHANQLVKENDQLQDMIRITEKDTIECFTLLQKKDEEKKNEVDVFWSHA